MATALQRLWQNHREKPRSQFSIRSLFCGYIVLCLNQFHGYPTPPRAFVGHLSFWRKNVANAPLYGVQIMQQNPHPWGLTRKKSACMSAMINLQYARTFLNMHTKVRLNSETSDKYSTF